MGWAPVIRGRLLVASTILAGGCTYQVRELPPNNWTGDASGTTGDGGGASDPGAPTDPSGPGDPANTGDYSGDPIAPGDPGGDTARGDSGVIVGAAASGVTLVPDTGVVANCVDGLAIVVTVRDPMGAPLGGQLVRISTMGVPVIVSQPTPPTDAAGMATGAVAPLEAGALTIIVIVNPGPREVVLATSPTRDIEPFVRGDLDGLVGHWALNDGSTPVTDYGPNGLDGVRAGTGGANNLPQYVPGRLGDGMSFDGFDDSVAIPDTGDAFDFGSGDFTLEAWVRTSDTCSASKAFVARESPTVTWSLGCDTFDIARFFARDVAGGFAFAAGGPQVNDGNWHHLVGVKTGGTLRIYVDGAFRAMGGGGFTTFDSTADFTIGHFGSSGGFMAADIDEVRVWNRALSASEVADAFVARCMVAYWPFEGNAADAMGRFDGNTEGGVSFVAGQQGMAVGLDGIDDAVRISLPEVFDDDYTTTFWFHTDATVLSQLLDHEIIPRTSLHAWIDASILRFTIVDQSGTAVVADSFAPLNDGNWHHAALVREGGESSSVTLRLFVDGMPHGTQTRAITFTNSSGNPMDVGRKSSDGSRRFRGGVDELRLYDRALDAAEIQNIYNASR